MVHLKDFALRHGFGADDAAFNLTAMLRPLLFVPPSMQLGVLLTKMQTERRHMALVIDEYGGVDGLVTIEDLIEQVVGEIEDEHDIDEGRYWHLEKAGQYIVAAKAPLEDFARETGLDLTQGEDIDTEEIETLGGLIFVLAGRVPVRARIVLHPFGCRIRNNRCRTTTCKAGAFASARSGQSRRMISALRRNWPALMLGLGAALGHAPWSLWVLSIASFILFFLWLARRTGQKLLDFFTSFWVFGTGYFILALSWIVEPFLVDAAAHGWMAPFALCLMASGMALFWALSGVGYVWLGPWGGLAFFGIGEWLRGHVFTGFPWGMPSYVLIETPLRAWFSVLGPYGATLLLLAVCLALARAIVYTSRREIGIAILGLLISASPMVWRVQSKSEPPLMSVRLVQPNAPQAQKWDPNFAPIFYERLIAATQQKPHPDLIVWPESAITNLLNYAPGYD